uniref:Uncharacterized protein n=1 Tax=Arundo donax TaxID=35708 RepID=A0A0A9EJG2_ARUDO
MEVLLPGSRFATLVIQSRRFFIRNQNQPLELRLILLPKFCSSSRKSMMARYYLSPLCFKLPPACTATSCCQLLCLLLDNRSCLCAVKVFSIF